jgi:hypothetical protein
MGTPRDLHAIYAWASNVGGCLVPSERVDHSPVMPGELLNLMNSGGKVDCQPETTLVGIPLLLDQAISLLSLLS